MWGWDCSKVRKDKKSLPAWGYLLGIFLVVGAGCVARAVKPTCEDTLFGPAVMKLADAPVVDRRNQEVIRPDTRQVSSLQEVKTFGKGEKEELYYLLTARQCQALAAAHAVLGNTLDEESELAAAVVGRGRTPRARAAALQSDLLRYGALAERNQAVAEALEWFYRLVEAETCWDLAQSALDVIQKAEGEKIGSDTPTSQPAGQSKEESQGSKEQGDAKESKSTPSGRWTHQRVQWQMRQEEADREIEHINSQLRPMLGAVVGDFRRIWPSANLTVKTEKLDADRAVTRGLEERADLRALRRLLRGMDADDLSAVRHALEQLHPGLGATPSRFPTLAQALGTAPQHMEAATREEQIRFLLARREKEVEEQIRQAAREVQQALQKVAQANQTYQTAFQATSEKGRSGSDEESEAKVSAQLALYEAQAELTSRVVAWKIAEVRLLEAVGILARESGYPLPDNAWEGLAL